ncbi:long-chain fatty acid--CoA ligase [Rapidithrix thailandica]|uniref:Long-chain fatty acid--CoA ligase n=1 Tax=Rapidithrix thailandica TaxID=413964 RepID=A0AAW9RU26_9BACT
MNTIDWMKKWAEYTPEKVALEEYESGRQITYRELHCCASHLASDFQQRGIRKGDRVMLLAEPCIENAILLSVAQKTGIILVPVSYRLSPPEIQYLIEHSEPSLILAEQKFIRQIEACRLTEHTSLRSLEDVREFCESKKHFSIERISNEVIKEEDPLFILYTSGTTGFPKGAIYTHKMLFWNSINTSISLDLSPEDTTVSCMPVFHTGGWNVLLTPLLHRGGKVYLLKKFEADTILRLIDEKRLDLFFGVPTMLKMMMESPEFASTELFSIRYFVVGGEALPLHVINAWHLKGIRIRQGYGLTEVGPNLTSLHQKDAIRKLGSIGRPNFYVETKIITETGQEANINTVGELCLRGPMVTPGYWKNPEATRKAIVQEWFHTGDLVKQDEEGYLYVVDRKKNMFISGGENVYPVEVERVLMQFEHVAEAAVIGIAHEKWGEVGKAFVVPKKYQEIDMEALKEFCLQNLAKFKVPKYFTFIEALPKTESGKINRKGLL